MLKELVTSLDEIPEGLREHYAPDRDGGFMLQISEGPLINALNRERQRRRDVEHRAGQHQSRADQLANEVEALTAQLHDANVALESLRLASGAKKREDMTPRERFMEEAGRRLGGLEGEALEAERAKLEEEMTPLIEAEIAAHRKEQQRQIERRQGTINRLMREQAAMDLVMRVRRPGVEAGVLMPLVLDRFHIEERNGELVTIVKGADDQPISLDALAEELRTTPALAPLIAGASADEKAAHARKVAETLGRQSKLN